MRILDFIKKRIKILVALILAIVSTYFIYTSIRPIGDKSETMVQVVAAANEIEADEIITEGMLTKISYPSSEVGSSLFTDDTLLLGKYTKTKILAGEPIRTERVTDENLIEDSQNAPMEREYRIKVDNVTYGGVVPGSRADILWTGSYNDQLEKVGGIVFENIQVLKVLNEYDENIYTTNQDKYNKQNANAAIVVLSLTQEQARTLDLLKEFAGKDMPFRLAKYTEKSEPQGQENTYIKMDDVVKVPGMKPADNQTNSGVKR